ncbi:BTAD domain-containing putative transcriptional regulator [Nocardia rhamnosiphila]|uniref:AfsR/SARP family transcriptional regulator n=1 Tax=Nocardia rhamnosiphila TaxID=426716 RepID=UPI0034034DB9
MDTLSRRSGPESVASYLHLFGGPYVTVGAERREIAEGSKRLLALLALRRGRVERCCAAGLLWPGVGERRASGNLRSALWRLRAADLDLVVADQVSLMLRAEVGVDVDEVSAWARRLIQGSAAAADLVLDPCIDAALDLLPGWYDDWALFERERLRHRVLHALESLSRQLCARGRCAEGVEAALLAVAADPIRESAQRALIEAHLSEGNIGEARHTYTTFHRLLLRELGVPPSTQLAGLLARPPISAVADRPPVHRDTFPVPGSLDAGPNEARRASATPPPAPPGRPR